MVTPSHLVAMHGQYMSAIQNEVQDYLTLFDAKKDIDYPDLSLKSPNIMTLSLLLQKVTISFI